MATILLTSEAFVKEVTSVSDNLAGKYLCPAIREAQEVRLKSVLGEPLLEKIKTLVKNNTISQTGNRAYKNLLDECQYYLAYTAIVEVTYKVAYKLGNIGVAKNTDDNVQGATEGEIEKMQYYYQGKADFYCVMLQNFLRDNRTSYPELSERQYNKIESNLHSAASCGIFLGGARGKGLSPKFCRRDRR